MQCSPKYSQIALYTIQFNFKQFILQDSKENLQVKNWPTLKGITAK